MTARTQLFATSCPVTGKWSYPTRAAARIARRRTGTGLSIYRCAPQPDGCGWFHIGHQPDQVRRGNWPKPAWLDTKERER